MALADCLPLLSMGGMFRALTDSLSLLSIGDECLGPLQMVCLYCQWGENA